MVAQQGRRLYFAAVVGQAIIFCSCVFYLFSFFFPSPILSGRRLDVYQTLHDVWQSPVLVHYIYILGALALLTEFCQVQDSLCVQVFHSAVLAVLLHGTGAVGISQTLRRSAEGVTYIQQGGHHVDVYQTLHILVEIYLLNSYNVRHH